MKINIKPNYARTIITQCFKQAWHSLRYKYILLLSFLPFCCSILLWVVVITLSITHFDWFLHQFPSIWINYALREGILPKISYYLLIFFATISLVLCGVVLVGICMSIINAFLAPLVVKFVHKTYYPYIRLNAPSFMESLRLSSMLLLKTLLKFIIFSLGCYLLSFIGLGFIGLILGIFVYFQFYCKNLNHDIGISIMSKDSYRLFLQTNRLPLIAINIFIFIPLYIPVLNCFIATWQMLVLTHYMFAWYGENHSNEANAYIEDAVIVE